MMNKDQRTHLNMNGADLLTQWPEVIPVFVRHRKACVGCSMSAFETLGDAAKIYGIVPDTFLEELHHIIRPSF